MFIQAKLFLFSRYATVFDTTFEISRSSQSGVAPGVACASHIFRQFPMFILALTHNSWLPLLHTLINFILSENVITMSLIVLGLIISGGIVISSILMRSIHSVASQGTCMNRAGYGLCFSPWGWVGRIFHLFYEDCMKYV